MRILELRLEAFGPFTDVHLDLSGRSPDLHVIHGPNEAGKTSALRAIISLLYGIPERTKDNFLHQKRGKLRIGARLETASGEVLDFVRLKKRKDPLETPQGEIFDAARLARALQGVTEEQFRAVFGLDHAGLSRGSLQLLSEGGEVGQALFSAGLGSTDLRAIVKQLDEEAEKLFLPTGRKPRINRDLEAYANEQKQLREASLSGSEWTARGEELRTKEARLVELQGERAKNAARRALYERLPLTGPRLRKLQDLENERESLGELPALAPAAAAEYAAAREALDEATVRAARAEAEMASLRQRLEMIEVPQDLLDHRTTLLALHRNLDTEVVAPQTRARLEAQRDEARLQARRLGDELLPGADEARLVALRRLLVSKERLQELGREVEEARREVRRTVKAAAEAEDRATRARAALPEEETDDLAMIRSRLDAARAGLHLDRDLEALDTELASLESEIDNGAVDLLPYRGVASDLVGLAVPALATIESHRDLLSDLQRDADRLREKIHELEDRERALALDLAELTGDSDLPTTAARDAARAHRDRGWDLVRARHDAGEDVEDAVTEWAGEQELFAAVEGAIRSADAASDALSDDATRLAERDRITREASRLEADREGLEARLRDLDRQLAERQREWTALWDGCGFAPTTPADMLAWRARRDHLAAQMASRDALRERHARSMKQRASLIESLELAEDAAATLGAAIRRAEERLEKATERHEAIQAARAEAERAAEVAVGLAREADEARKSADTAVATWKAALADRAPDLVLDAAEADVFLERARELFARRDDAESVERELRANEEVSERFAEDAKRLASAVAPELESEPAEVIIGRLMTACDEALKLVTRRETLEKERERHEAEQAEVDRERLTAERRLTDLRAQTGATDDAALARLFERIARDSELSAAIEAVHDELAEIGAGRRLDALAAESEGVDLDALPALRERLGSEDEHLAQQEKALQEEVWELKSRLEASDASEVAAELAGSLASRRAALVRDAGLYLRARLAARVLTNEIERFRREHQGPVLERTSELFQRLTLGEFRRVRTELDAEGQQLLEGERRSGDRLRPEAMSTGTRDQLYFALRLATLERFLDIAEPMPLIVEDLLVNFDDARATEAFKILGELARKTQVLVFTHHAHAVELVRRALPGAQRIDLPTVADRSENAGSAGVSAGSS